ncbi:amidase signature domain-containing protein [Xylariaceae sp. FL0255]|nr:amidase signature domain-containing protein [Xylariaceae sp. FL0255]
MTTCAGSLAFRNAQAIDRNAAVVQKLLDVGMIILAKANMTEFAGMKTLKMMPGWSPHGGQTISPYVGQIKEDEKILGHSVPGGSSTGSAVSVAAGFSPLAIGVETIGSIITPSTRAAVYALKPTVGCQDTTGMYRLSDSFDSPGPMGKCAGDVLRLGEIMLGHSLATPSLGTWNDIAVAFLDPKKWRLEEEICDGLNGTAEQMVRDYEVAISKLQRAGCEAKYPVDLPDTSALRIDGKDVIVPLAYWEFKNITIPQFINAFHHSPVRSLSDIIKFNERHRSEAMPEPYTEQDQLVKADESNERPEDMTELQHKIRLLGKSILDQVFDREHVNVIAALGDSSICIHAAATGYPLAAVPLSTLEYNGRPFGLCLIAKGDGEQALMRFMHAWEKTMPPRDQPDLGRFD